VPQGTPWELAFHNAVIQVHEYFIGAVPGVKVWRWVFIEVHVDDNTKNLLISGITGSSRLMCCSFDAERVIIWCAKYRTVSSGYYTAIVVEYNLRS